MAKSNLQIKARKLRSNGLSIKQITQAIGASKSSISYWVRDITLSEEQLALLKDSESRGKRLGRLKSIQIKKAKRKKVLANFSEEGIEKLLFLTKNELFVSGLALYWAEGGKSFRNRRVEFCNSDPRMIEFFLRWLRICLGITKENLKCVVGINQIHSQRDMVVKEYWSNITSIPLPQFRKTSFKKVDNSKTYSNFDEHYGTLTVLVNKSTNLYYQIMGLLEGLSKSKVMAT